MFQWISSLMDSMGYFGVVFLMFLENVFPPIPSELIMPLAGYLAGQGKMTLLGAWLAGTFGSVLGALPLYYVGHALGKERLKVWAAKHGAWLTVSPEEIEKSSQWFERHGGKAVFLCRLVPGIRSLISIPAGIGKMAMLPFLAFTALGSSIWSGVLCYAGFQMGQNYKAVEKFMDPGTKIVIGILVLIYIYRFISQQRAQKQSA